MRRTTLLTLLAVPALTGCVIGQDKYPRPRDLVDQTIVDRIRVLSVRAEPPEVSPGTPVSFQALVTDPNDEIDTVMWLACPPDSASGFGCSLDLSVLEGGAQPTPQELAEAGVIGIEPFMPPQYTPGPELLEGLEGQDLREGINVTVQVIVLPTFDEETELDGFDFNQVEVAYKRLIVSEATTPNRNPVATGFVVEGEIIDEETLVVVDAGGTYEIGATVDPATVEGYEYLNSDGVLEDRVEEPYVTWYTTSGSLRDQYSLFPCDQTVCDLRTDWTAPSETGATGTWYGVVRDRRGGMTWVERSWAVQ